MKYRMYQNIISKIFDSFFTTKPVGTGTGLGISLAHSIIAEHGGTIGVESSQGRGASFFIEIPRDEINKGKSSNNAQKR